MRRRRRPGASPATRPSSASSRRHGDRVVRPAAAQALSDAVSGQPPLQHLQVSLPVLGNNYRRKTPNEGVGEGAVSISHE